MFKLIFLTQRHELFFRNIMNKNNKAHGLILFRLCHTKLLFILGTFPKMKPQVQNFRL